MVLTKKYWHHSRLDLDVYNTWAILSVGLVVAVTANHMSHTLKESAYRRILTFWGILLTLGVAVSVANGTGDYAMEDLFCPSQSTNPPKPSNCTYECLATRQILRRPSELVIIPANRIWGADMEYVWWTMFLVAQLLAVLWMIIRCCFAPRKSTIENLEDTVRTFK